MTASRAGREISLVGEIIMRTQDAKKLSLPELLSRLGHQPVRTNGPKLWYRSPLRQEHVPSFCIEPGRRVAWVFSDHGTNVRGNILDFAMHYQQCSLKEALAWLGQIFETAVPATAQQPVELTALPLEILKVKPIQHPLLIAYLNGRAISKELARRYLWEVRYLNAGQPRFALGWKTDSGGWCLRARNFKASVRPAGLTTLGKASEYLAVFEGMFDFLAALVYYRATAPKGQVVVLNGINNIPAVTEKISAGNYQCIRLYLDNDQGGRQATQRLLSLKNTMDCSALFSPAKDFAELVEAAVRGNNLFPLPSKNL